MSPTKADSGSGEIKKRGVGGAIRAAATVCDQEQTSHMELISTVVMSQVEQTREFWGNLGFPGHKLLSG